MSTVPPVITRKRGQLSSQEKQQEEKKKNSIQVLDVAPVKRRRSTVEEQDEQEQPAIGNENKIDGELEGELFQVTIRSRDELQESEDAVADAQKVDQLLRLKQLATCTAANDADVAWNLEFQAIDALRRFAKHHQDEAQRQLNNGILTTLVLPAASNLRSTMARNALLCVQDLILALKTEMAVHLAVIVPVLLNRACFEKQFLRDLAREVLDTALQAGSDEKFLQPLLATSATEKNALIVSVAGLYVTKCIIQMDCTYLRTFVLEMRESFFEELAIFLNCKVVECKAATRRTCQHIRRVIGNDDFVALVNERLCDSKRLDVLKASESHKAAKAGRVKTSIRERMLRLKKQQQQQNKVQGGGSDISIVVVTPPRSRASSTQAPPSL